MSTALQSEDLAFESLYRLHRPPVYAYALSKLRQPADAEDATQTTFLNAYCALHRGIAPRDDLQWLLAIARNVCHDRFRDTKRRPKEEPLTDWMRLVQPEEPDYTVGEMVKEISELNPRYRQILLLREFEGRSYTEISAQLGVTEPAVQTMLARARRALRDELELGMTCTHARRVAVRHLNGVALRDERRALQRHLRKCADCATFVGRTPRTPIAQLLWLAWVPYRRLMAIFTGASAVPGSTAGAGALAAKLIAITVVGGTAAGVVTVQDAIDGSSLGQRMKAPPRPAAVVKTPTVARRVVAPSAAVSSWGSTKLAKGRQPLTHTSHARTWLPEVSASPASAVGAAASSGSIEPSATAAESAPPPTEVAESAQPTPAAVQETAPASEVETSSTNAAPAEAGTLGSSDASAVAAADSTAASPSTASPVSTDPAAAGSVPATTPPAATTPTPPGQEASRGNGNGIGNGNAVGQGGMPPGQLNKPDPPAHGLG